jgi:ribonuclease G
VETTQAVKDELLGPNEAHREALEELLQLKLFFSVQSSARHYFTLKQFGSVFEISSKEFSSD